MHLYINQASGVPQQNECFPDLTGAQAQAMFFWLHKRGSNEFFVFVFS